MSRYSVTVDIKGYIIVELEANSHDDAVMEAVEFLQENLQCYAVSSRKVKVSAAGDVELEVFESSEMEEEA